MITQETIEWCRSQCNAHKYEDLWLLFFSLISIFALYVLTYYGERFEMDDATYSRWTSAFFWFSVLMQAAFVMRQLIV